MKKYLISLILIAGISINAGVIQKRPRAYSFPVAPSGSLYTELNVLTITPTGTVNQFNDYDLYTAIHAIDSNFQKGDVVEIIALNNSTTATFAGVRTDGSSVDRKIDMDGYYSTGGSMSLRFTTTVHATTGLIEIYAENNSNITFIVVGYWSGVTWTERFDSITVGSTEDAQWFSVNVNTLFSTPVSRVYDFMLVNNANATHVLGLRSEAETSLERKIETPGVYQGGSAGFNLFGKLDAAGLIKVYLELYSSDTCYSMGYFDDTVDYQERFDDITPTADDTWQDKDLTAYTSSPLQAEILMLVSLGGVEIGSCKDGSVTTTRKITEGVGGTASTSTYIGTPFTCNLDASDVLQVRSSNYSRSLFYHAGYFK